MTAVNQSPKAAKVEDADPEWLIEARRSSDWIEAHRDELLAQYDGQWIAVANQQLIAHDPDPLVVRIQAQERGFPLALCDYITSEVMRFA